MDKARFIEIAPMYYALAIMHAVRNKGRGKALTLEGIIDIFTIVDDDDPEEPFRLLARTHILDRAIRLLGDNELVEIIEDDFGSPLFLQKTIFQQDRPEILDDPRLPFVKYDRAADGEGWLHSALRGINLKYAELAMSPEDFVQPDREWEPIPLDRGNPQLHKAVEAIDATLKHVREDNGYNATVPEERNYVIASLSTASQALKTETSTSVPFIQHYILEPLAKLGRRFAGATIGLLSQAAREAIIEYVKQNAPAWITEIIARL